MARPTAAEGLLKTFAAILETIVVALLLLVAVATPSRPLATARDAPTVSESRSTEATISSGDVSSRLEPAPEPGDDVAHPPAAGVPTDDPGSPQAAGATGRQTAPSATLPATDTVSPAVDRSD